MALLMLALRPPSLSPALLPVLTLALGALALSLGLLAVALRL